MTQPAYPLHSVGRGSGLNQVTGSLTPDYLRLADRNVQVDICHVTGLKLALRLIRPLAYLTHGFFIHLLFCPPPVFFVLWLISLIVCSSIGVLVHVGIAKDPRYRVDGTWSNHIFPLSHVTFLTCVNRMAIYRSTKQDDPIARHHCWSTAAYRLLTNKFMHIVV